MIELPQKESSLAAKKIIIPDANDTATARTAHNGATYFPPESMNAQEILNSLAAGKEFSEWVDPGLSLPFWRKIERAQAFRVAEDKRNQRPFPQSPIGIFEPDEDVVALNVLIHNTINKLQSELYDDPTALGTVNHQLIAMLNGLIEIVQNSNRRA